MNGNSINESDNLANKYQQKTDKQHILDNPDTYIGSIENVESDLWVLDAPINNNDDDSFFNDDDD